MAAAAGERADQAMELALRVHEAVLNMEKHATAAAAPVAERGDDKSAAATGSHHPFQSEH